jgi:hypothetical protein
MEGHEGNPQVRTQICSLRVLGPLDGAPESACYWLPLVLLHPSIYSLWAVLTHQACFAFEP